MPYSGVVDGWYRLDGIGAPQAYIIPSSVGASTRMKARSNACDMTRIAGDHGSTGFIASVRLWGRPQELADFSRSCKLARRSASLEALGGRFIESATQGSTSDAKKFAASAKLRRISQSVRNS